MKGQTAIEYLMTYGWAILIILIVAGVLAYYGIFAPGSFLGPSSKGFVQVAILSPWKFDPNGDLSMQVENRVGQDINITRVFAGIGTGGTTVTCTVFVDYPAGKIVPAGARYPSNALNTSVCGSTLAGSSGASYTISVAIEFYVGATGFNSTGTLSGTRS